MEEGAASSSSSPPFALLLLSFMIIFTSGLVMEAEAQKRCQVTGPVVASCYTQCQEYCFGGLPCMGHTCGGYTCIKIDPTRSRCYCWWIC